MGTNYAIHVGVIVKEHLDALGLTQKELCARIEVSTTIINEPGPQRYICGKTQ